MKYALVAGDYFDINQKSEYVETIVSKCINHYISLAQGIHDWSNKEKTPPTKAL